MCSKDSTVSGAPDVRALREKYGAILALREAHGRAGEPDPRAALGAAAARPRDGPRSRAGRARARRHGGGGAPPRLHFDGVEPPPAGAGVEGFVVAGEDEELDDESPDAGFAGSAFALALFFGDEE